MVQAPRFAPAEGAWLGLRRLALSELSNARELLSDSSLDPYGVLHETRKSIKRLRALLRLVQKPLRRGFRRLDGRLQATAHTLSGVREAAAAIEALDGFAGRAPSGERTRFERARTAFVEAQPRRLLVVRALLLDVRSELGLVRQRVQDWPELPSGFEVLERGFRGTYRRTRRAFRRAKLERTAHVFHELRKALKAHLHQCEFLEGAWPERLAPHALALADLARTLGEHHDLALLISDLRKRGFEDLAAGATERAACLEQEILLVGRPLLHERARSFTKALAAHFETFSSRASHLD